MTKPFDLLPQRTQVAVDYLVDNLKKTLYLEKEESVPVYELLSVVAAQYNMTAEHYCEVRSREASLKQYIVVTVAADVCVAVASKSLPLSSPPWYDGSPVVVWCCSRDTGTTFSMVCRITAVFSP